MPGQRPVDKTASAKARRAAEMAERARLTREVSEKHIDLAAKLIEESAQRIDRLDERLPPSDGSPHS